MTWKSKKRLREELAILSEKYSRVHPACVELRQKLANQRDAASKGGARFLLEIGRLNDALTDTRKGEIAADKEVQRLEEELEQTSTELRKAGINCGGKVLIGVRALIEHDRFTNELYHKQLKRNTNQQGGNMSNDLKDLRDKVRKNKRDINDLETSVENLEDNQRVHVEAHNELEARVVALETNGPVEPEEPTGHPPRVHDIATLRQFITAQFGEDYFIKHATSRRQLCGPVRDELALRYSDIERVNDQGERHGYTADDEKHRDAIYYWDALAETYTIIDFCRDSSNAGTLENNLQWVPVTETPW